MAVQHGAHEFRDDDTEYLKWLAHHPAGYVINILRSHKLTGAKVHRATCWTINGLPRRGGTWTEGDYVKVCADKLADLHQWAQSLESCGTCNPNGTAGPTRSRKQSKKVGKKALQEGRFDFHGPVSDSAAVQAWADDYLRFENLPPWQKDLREEIRNGCGQLEPSSEQVMHARFFGDKHPRADVENLVLYYIDSFKAAGQNGIRFEHGDTMPSAGDAEYQYCYSYSLAPRAESFSHWCRGDMLASFGWTNLGVFTGDKKLAQVWWALPRKEIKVSKRAAPDTPFGVRVEIRPPYRRKPVWGGLVKGIFDGVICALQNYTDPVIPQEVLERLAKYLPPRGAGDDMEQEIESLLRDPQAAVLGGVPRLVSPYRSGVKWDPSDHFCVAGELLAVEPESGDGHWWIKGEVFELSRQAGSPAHTANRHGSAAMPITL